MNNIKFEDCLYKFALQLPKGVFLNVRAQNQDNTMTIGWGLAGVIWSRPTVAVAVRYSRYTYELIEKSGLFTLSVPVFSTMARELAYAGSKSGRDVDKFKELGLDKVYADSIDTPFIKGCDFHFACKTVYQQSMEPSLIKSDSVSKFYDSHDYHVLYYGEVVGTYAE